jgi:acyl-CoA synthetase (AMP-forming)/AMP-acid ligase II
MRTLSRARDGWTHAREVLTSVARGAKANFAWDPASERTLPLLLQQWAREAPDDPFVWFEGRWTTVGELNRQCNRAAHRWLALGIRRGDVVALMLSNRPEFIVHFYALLKLGAVAALINPALRGRALSHALSTAGARGWLLDATTVEAVEHLSGSDALVDRIRTLDAEDAADQPGVARFEPSKRTDNPPASSHHQLADVAAYIYTSGTTGLPKAAVVKHHRLIRAGMVMGAVLRFTSRDTLYCCLPLYHGNGSMISVPVALTHRGRIALARRFSASRFWADCADSGATAAIYVGEVCRYLANRAPGPDERAHSVRRMIGNGLQPDLWPVLEERFGVESIHEFYAATEGNAETINLFGREGSCGPLLPWKMAVVRYDHDTGDVVRDARGRCSWTRPGEPGLLLGKITRSNEYAGYADQRASRSKVKRDVFRGGDEWFDTGDLVSYDVLLHLRFVDRLGDTFRWKSENVSTREVSEAVLAAPQVLEASVYGVPVPGHEGRTGMAAVVVDGGIDGRALFAAINASLPSYAAPRFVREVDSLEVTGTFKHRKQELQREGFGPGIADALWIRDPDQAQYVPLDAVARARLDDGRWKL